jgi:hypothetical protein
MIEVSEKQMNMLMEKVYVQINETVSQQRKRYAFKATDS